MQTKRNVHVNGVYINFVLVLLCYDSDCDFMLVLRIFFCVISCFARPMLTRALDCNEGCKLIIVRP